MAAQELDETDGIFINVDDSLDEVDASAVFTVIERATIPDKFVSKAGTPVRQKSQSYSLLPRSWGTLLTHVVEKEGLYGLVTLRGDGLTDTSAPAVSKHLVTSSAIDHRVAPLRWNTRHLLVAFDSTETYENWGNLLLEGRLQAGPDHQVTALEPAIFCSVPKALVSVTSRQGHDLHASLADPIMPFSATFTQLRVTVDESAPAPLPTDTLPHLTLTLMFEGKNQVLALKSLERLSVSPWKPLPLSHEVTRALDYLKYFQNTLGGPLIGVKTGCPQAGIQIMILVKSKESFENMAHFYMNLLSVDSVSRKVQTPHICYTIFPLSARSELMVTYFPGVKVSTSPELDLHVKVKDLSKVNAEEMAGGSFHLTDPDGNSVIASVTEANI